MKVIEIFAFGEPSEVVRCAERPDPPAPGPKEVLVRMLAMSINPADLLIMEGRYGHQPELPAVRGAEGVGEIVALGEGVKGLEIGQKVVPFAVECWQELMLLRASALIPLPDAVDLRQAAMLKANPATAVVMLSDIVPLKTGDWVIQNAANSAVGRFVRLIAKRDGIRTVNLVRRPGLEAELKAEGGDVVLVNDGGDDLEDQVLEATGGVRPLLGLDAVGGAATRVLATTLAEGGVIANYGLLSGQPCQIDAQQLVFRNVTLRGFWLSPWFAAAGPDRIKAVYQRLVALLSEGALEVPVEATYPLEEAKAAIAHAAKGGRGGKILFTTEAGRNAGLG
ncbi:MAG: zinc-dependent alcohol dehydrogenase family protein [Rhodospirillales bacterium]